MTICALVVHRADIVGPQCRCCALDCHSLNTSRNLILHLCIRSNCYPELTFTHIGLCDKLLALLFSMKSCYLLAVALATVTSAQTISGDATCGASNKFTCLGSSFGDCCSSAGWCGSTPAYCGDGCQSEYGRCGSNDQASSTTATTATGSAASTATTSPISTGILSQCLDVKDVPYKTSSNPEYGALSQPYNLRLPYKPAVIVLPTTNQHVQDAVSCGSQTGLKIQAKSGGHSYASYSSGGQDGAMGMSLNRVNNVCR